MRFKKATVPVHMYHSGVVVHIGKHADVKAEFVRRGGNQDRFKAAEGLCVNFEDVYSFVFVEPQMSRAKTVAVLAHELLHAAHHILDRANVPHGVDNQEPLTFLLEYLIQESMARLKL